MKLLRKLETGIVLAAGVYAVAHSVKSCVGDCKLEDKVVKELKMSEGLNTKDYSNIINAAESPISSTYAKRIYYFKNAADSLKMKAACEKAYLEGANMVRDSIKNSAKAIK